MIQRAVISVSRFSVIFLYFEQQLTSNYHSPSFRHRSITPSCFPAKSPATRRHPRPAHILPLTSKTRSHPLAHIQPRSHPRPARILPRYHHTPYNAMLLATQPPNGGEQPPCGCNPPPRQNRGTSLVHGFPPVTTACFGGEKRWGHGSGGYFPWFHATTKGRVLWPIGREGGSHAQREVPRRERRVPGGGVGRFDNGVWTSSTAVFRGAF